MDIGIHDVDGRGDAKNSDGFFDKGVSQALESDHSAGSKMKEVKVISNGHCHGTFTFGAFIYPGCAYELVSDRKLSEDQRGMALFLAVEGMKFVLPVAH